jgi:excisionase family DNA binding protein
VPKFPNSVLNRAPESLPRRAYRIPEAARILGVGRSKIYKMLDTGSLGGVKDGVTRLITADSVEALLRGERS